VTDRGNDLALVEAALFLSPQPMTRRGIAKVLGDVRLAYVDQLLEDLAQTYSESKRGIELMVDEGRATLRVKRDYIDRVAHLAPQQDIPRPILRTLAVIAYNQPVTQADVIRVRGNKGYSHISDLVDRGLVRAEEHGRTLLLHVTKEFLRHFGLRSADELKFHAPPLEELLSQDEASPTMDGAPHEEDSPADATSEEAVDGEPRSSDPSDPDAPERAPDVPELGDEAEPREEEPSSAGAVTDDPNALQSDDSGGT
jgi:segregation and condensation protein B